MTGTKIEIKKKDQHRIQALAERALIPHEVVIIMPRILASDWSASLITAL